MRYAFALAVLPACLVVMPGTALSAADDAELERVRSAIAEAIAPGDDPEMPRLELAAPVDAAWRDGRIIVSLKQARLVAPDEDVALAIGDVELAVQPRGQGYYAFDVTMPQRFEIIENGAPEGAITLSTSRIGGIWASEIESFSMLDLSITGIDAKDLTPETANFGAMIETLEAQISYSKGVDGLWSGASSARLTGIKVHAEDSPSESNDFTLASIETSSTTTGWDWNGLHRVMTKVEQAFEPGAPAPTEQERVALASEIRSVNWGVNQGVMTLSGLSVGAGGAHLFDLGDFTWKLAFDGSSEAGPLTIRLAMTDLAVTENELPPDLAPSKAAIDVTLEQFPVRAFFGSILAQVVSAMSAEAARPVPPPVESEPLTEPAPATTIPAEPEPMMEAPASEPGEAPSGIDEPPAEPMPGDEDGMGMDMEMDDPGDDDTMPPAPDDEPYHADEPGYHDEYEDEMPMPDQYGGEPMMGPLPMDDPFFQSVFSLGTAIVLNELSVDAPSVGMIANGRVDIDPEAIGMGTGRVKATLRGIDSVLAYVESLAQADPEMKDISTFLIFLKGLGKAEVGADNEVVYVYDINVPKDEAPTVNGYLIDEVMFD